MAAISVDDPHYVHPSDVPGLKLVANIFEGPGFGNWKRAMTIALSAKNKVGFVDGSIPKPASTDAMAKNWQRCNDIVFSWILNSLSPEIAESILYSATAQLAWKELEDRFGQSNGAQLYGVQKKLSDFGQGNDSITSYFTKMKSIWDEIEGMGVNPRCSCACSCGAKDKLIEFLETQKVIQFLMGLNDSYSIVRGSILMQSPLPKLSTVYNNLLQEERQREIHHAHQFQSDSVTAMYAKGNSQNNNGNNYSGQRFNNNGNNNNSGSNQGNRGQQYKGNNNYKGKNQNSDVNAGYKRPYMECAHCKKPGHTIENCWNLQRKNRRFAGNVFTDGDMSNGQDGQNTDPNFEAEISGGAANFVGLSQEALGPW